MNNAETTPKGRRPKAIKPGDILWFVVIAICIIVIFVKLPRWIQSRRYSGHAEVHARMYCAINLRSLGSAMAVYADDHNDNYPAVNKWCDILLQLNFVTQRNLVCRGALASGDKGRCHYAMNPNCEPNSPGDMVLLFETRGGWNQFGGPEILTTDNHGGKGCNISFNDCSVKFVEKKDLAKLKWKVEEGKELTRER